MEATADIERGLLGSLILDPTNIDQLAADLNGIDFANPDFGHFFEALAIAREAGVPVGDPKVLAAELRHQHVPKTVSTAAFVARLAMDAVASNAPHYAKLVRRGAELRRLEALGHALIAKTTDDGADPEAITKWLDAQQNDIGSAGSTEARLIGEVAGEWLMDLAKPAENRPILMTGIQRLDQTVGGWMGGELVTVAARTGMGKTALAMQVAAYNASRGRGVLFVSLEMKDQELVSRILCGNADVDSRRLRASQPDVSELSRLCKAQSDIADDPLVVWSPPRAMVGQIRATARREHAKRKLRLIVVDYVQYVEPTDKRVNRSEQIGEIMRSLKALAKELDIVVLSLAQLNRESDKMDRPRLSHLRESGSIEMDSDAVLFIHKKSSEATETELLVAKHRHYRTGKIMLEWDGQRTRFNDPNEFPGY